MAKLIFDPPLDEALSEEVTIRGYVNFAHVEIDGKLYKVHFWEYRRLGQDFDEEIKWGHTFMAEPGLIVLDIVTIERMQSAVDKLETTGYFEHLVPIQSKSLT